MKTTVRTSSGCAPSADLPRPPGDGEGRHRIDTGERQHQRHARQADHELEPVRHLRNRDPPDGAAVSDRSRVARDRSPARARGDAPQNAADRREREWRLEAAHLTRQRRLIDAGSAPIGPLSPAEIGHDTDDVIPRPAVGSPVDQKRNRRPIGLRPPSTSTKVSFTSTRPVFRVGRRQRPAADHGRTDHVEESRIDGHDPDAVVAIHTVFPCSAAGPGSILIVPPYGQLRHLIGVRDVQHARVLSEPVGERAVACFESRRTHRRHRVTRRDAVKAIHFERGREMLRPGILRACLLAEVPSQAEQRPRKQRRERNLRR